MELLEPAWHVIGRTYFVFGCVYKFLGVSHSSRAENVSDFIDGSVDLRGSGGSSTQFDKNILYVLNALSFDQEPLHVFLSLL